MGVRRSDWIILGAHIDTDYFNNEWYEMDESPLDKYDENQKVGEITYLYDGMSGEYFIVGEVIQCDPEGENGLKLFDYRKVIDTEYIKSVEKVKAHLKENFGIEEPDVNLQVITHWA